MPNKDDELTNKIIQIAKENGLEPWELEEYIFHWKRMNEIIQKAVDRQYLKDNHPLT